MAFDTIQGAVDDTTRRLQTEVAFVNIDAADPVVRDSDIRYVGDGVLISNTDGASVAGNDIRYVTGAGISIDADSNTVRDSLVTDSTAGISVTSGSTGNTIEDNAFAGNSIVDCDDDSTGGRTEDTGNTWHNNTGPSDSPDGIRSADEP